MCRFIILFGFKMMPLYTLSGNVKRETSQKRRNFPQWEVAHKKKRKVFGPVTNKDRVKYKKRKKNTCGFITLSI